MTLRQENRKIYAAWKALKQRCLNPKAQAYDNYGARGITVCDEWMEFEPFCDWANSFGDISNLDLDRIDNDLGYSPENCRWVSRRENVNNRRKTVRIIVNNIEKPASVWAEDIGVNRHLIIQWVRNGGLDYAAFRIADALENGYIHNDYAYSHRKRIKHVESGMVFNSEKEAGEYFGLAACTISSAISTGRLTRAGSFVFESEELTTPLMVR